MTGRIQRWVDRKHAELLYTPVINTGMWQGIDVSGSRYHDTYELVNETFVTRVPDDITRWQTMTTPSLPWAENHFMERVSGVPHNPPPSHVDWPWARRGNGDHIAEGKFDHTYPERLWPKHAGEYWSKYNLTAHGIRFTYGDLNDVVGLLVRQPLTRQAFLPVWFPEDTGANGGTGRVPCTIGYHFLIRNGRMSITYFIRSCDLIRHFLNDVYMAGRLLQWVCDEYNRRAHDGTHPNGTCDFQLVTPEQLTMHITSLHMFVGDANRGQ